MDAKFDKGIYEASLPLETPEGFYLNAINIRDQAGVKKADDGMTKISIPDNVISHGNCSIAEHVIILGVKEGKTVIGTYNTKTGIWTEVLYQVTDVLLVTGPTQVVGRKDWKGDKIIYFSTPTGARRINLDSLPSIEDFDKITSLFLDYSLPKIEFLEQKSTGEVLTGVYQFASRLVTASEAETPFGIMTGVIPVGKSSVGASRQDTIGGNPQDETTKSISLSITDIDTAFKYIQIAVVTYVGLASVPTVHVSNLIQINDRTSLNFTYYGSRDHLTQIPLTEFIASGISYDTGTFFTQKDNTLLVGAPTEKDLPNIDWHRVAAGIASEYIIKEITYAENLQFEIEEKGTGNTTMMAVRETSENIVGESYKNPKTCEKFKTYRRGEVYGFTITPVFKSGVLGPTVHIPAYSPHLNSGIEATVYTNVNDGGLLGAFISEEEYPDDRYPGIVAGFGLRLHKFPDAKQQPLVSGDVETNDLKIRLLGVKFSNIVLHASEIQFEDLLDGYIIGRLDRTNNETQLAQGVLRPNQNVQFNNDPTHTRCSSLGDGHVAWALDLSAGGTATGSYPVSHDFTDFSFISPDIIHNLHSSDEATHIYQHSNYKSNPYTADSFYNYNNFPARDALSRPVAAFKNITGSGESYPSLDTTKIELDASKKQVNSFGSPRQPSSKGGKENTTLVKGNEILKMCSSDGFEWMSTKNGATVPRAQGIGSQYYVQQKIGVNVDEDRYVPFNPFVAFPNTAARAAIIASRHQFVLYSLYRSLPKQYGALDQMVSMQTHYQSWSDGSSTEFFNGDTFINKYGLSINDEGYYPYAQGEESAGDEYYGFLKPINFSMVVYMWIESSNNYDYKHYIEPDGFSADSVTSTASVPYFPAYKILSNNELPLGILSMAGDGWYRPGYASQYNRQYTADPNLKPYAVTPKEDQENKAVLSNRVLYSSQAVQGEKADSYQIFLPNNYYDVPTERGILTDIYVNKELYASTAEVQWMLFFNTMATQATSIGEVVLGSGGAFNRPAVPLQTLDGGYGGTAHWTHSIPTIEGRFFVDKTQGLIFLIGQEGMMITSKFLSEKYKTSIPLLDDDAIRLGSEPFRERIYVRLGTEMLSFNTDKKMFISRHNLFPRWMISHGPHVYGQKANNSSGSLGHYRFSTGLPGYYFGISKSSSITLVANMGKSQSKNFKNLELITTFVDYTNKVLPFKTFDQIEVWNDFQYSGVNTLTVKTSAFEVEEILHVLASKIKNSYRLGIPRDIVNDVSLNIFNTSNHKQLAGDVVPSKWLEKMKGNYVCIRLTSFNTTGHITLQGVKFGVTENIR
jgi:hypothetical protein